MFFMQKILLLLGFLGALLPSVSLASGKADLVDSLISIYGNTGDEIHAIVRSDPSSTERRTQAITATMKSKHDAAMAAIQNTR